MKPCLATTMTMAVLFAMSTVALGQGLDTDTPDLPPDGVYISPDEFHQYAAAGIILDDPIHRPFVATAVVTPVGPDGPDERETFESEFEAVEIGLGLGSIVLTGPVEVLTRNKWLSTAGQFDTEIVSMSLSGNTPSGLILIRESPSRASTGQTDITDLGGGLYHIDSFFDVFTELSVDGGSTWIASDASTRMFLVPSVPSVPAMPGWAMAITVLLLAAALMRVIHFQRTARV